MLQLSAKALTKESTYAIVLNDSKSDVKNKGDDTSLFFSCSYAINHPQKTGGDCIGRGM